MKPFEITIESGVEHAQAFGCWLYLQLGSIALKAGRKMPCGLRFVWRRALPRVAFVRFTAA